MPTSLCIETSSPFGELALFNDLDLVESVSWGHEHTHSEILNLKFQELLKAHKTHPKDLKQIIVSYGPGSFTGLRVGLNFAKALAYSFELPIYLSSSFRGELNLKALQKHKEVFVLRKALKNRFYLAQYKLDISEKIVEKVFEKTFSYFEIQELIKMSPHIYLQAPKEVQTSSFLNPDVLKKISFIPYNEITKYCRNHFHFFCTSDNGLNLKKSDWKTAYPLYIRASEAEEKLKLGELKLHTKRKL